VHGKTRECVRSFLSRTVSDGNFPTLRFFGSADIMSSTKRYFAPRSQFRRDWVSVAFRSGLKSGPYIRIFKQRSLPRSWARRSYPGVFRRILVSISFLRVFIVQPGYPGGCQRPGGNQSQLRKDARVKYHQHRRVVVYA
jgi:hypothetical protein